MNLIERLDAAIERETRNLPMLASDVTIHTLELSKTEIERLTAQVGAMREVEKEIILRLQWAHCTTYHKDMEALFREILAAENPLQHLKELTFAFTALSYRGGDCD